MALAWLLPSNPFVIINLDRGEITKTTRGREGQQLLVFSRHEHIEGCIDISSGGRKDIEHQGIKLELIGFVGMCLTILV